MFHDSGCDPMTQDVALEPVNENCFEPPSHAEFAVQTEAPQPLNNIET